MKFEKHWSEKNKGNYLSCVIPKSEIEGLQADVFLTLKVERDQDSKVPSIGWKMKLDNDKEYGDFVDIYVKSEFI